MVDTDNARYRIILVDDHVLLRRALRLQLDDEADIEVVAEADSAEELLNLIERMECDLVLLDMFMDGKDGIWCTRELKKRRPEVKVLMLTEREDQRAVTGAIEAGVDGYLIKSAVFEDLMSAIRELRSGGSYLHSRVAGRVMHAMRNPAAPTTDTLTAREMDTLRLLRKTRSLIEIADMLSVSHNTVKSHVQSIYRKLGVTDRTQAILSAISRGLIEEPPPEK